MAQKRLKILHLIDSARHGGAEEILATLVSTLSCTHYEHYVVLPDAGWLYRQLVEQEGISVVLFDGKGRFNLSFVFFLVRLIKANKIDLVQTHLFGTSLYGAISGFICHVPVVCTFHGFIDLPAVGSLTKLKFALIGLLSKRIVAVSNCLKAHLGQQFRYGGRKILTIYNGIDLSKQKPLSRSEARAKIGVAENTVLVGAIGNIKQAKGYDVLIRTAAEFNNYDDSCLFMVAGKEDVETFPALILLRNRLDLETKVLFVGYLDNPQDFLQALDVLLLTSKSEGFSLVVIQAMNASVPVVASRSGGPEEIITHDVDGVLADVGDANGLALSLQRILNDQPFRDLLVKNAEVTVQNRFSARTMVQCYENVYEELLCH